MNKVYILGAGASAGYENSEVGLRSPTARNFFAKTGQLISDNHLNRGFFENLFRFLEKYYNLKESELSQCCIDIEEVLTVLDLNEDKFSFARRELIRLIYLTLDKILYGDPCPHHKCIVDQLDNDDTIITFNWDLLVDNLISKHQAQKPDYQYTFDKIFRVGSWEPDRSVSKGPKLLKLHGSFNWMYCKKCEAAYAFVLTGKTAADQIRDPEDGRLKCPACKGQTDPVIIPPTLSKAYEVWTVINSAWERARKSLESADEIMIIGYSMPVTDFQAKWLFLESVAKRTKPLRKLTVVDKYPNGLFGRYREIFRISDRNFEGIQGEIKCLSCNTQSV